MHHEEGHSDPSSFNPLKRKFIALFSLCNLLAELVADGVFTEAIEGRERLRWRWGDALCHRENEERFGERLKKEENERDGMGTNCGRM